MSYQAPTITSAGLVTTNAGYTDCRDDLISIFLSIYGQNTYVGVDSAPYQLISAFSAKWNDVVQLLKLIFNAQSPSVAVGVHLDLLAKLLGATRLPASASTAPMLISGTPNRTIVNAKVRDQNGNIWDLPASVTIGNVGTVNVTATCETLGAVSAEINTITAQVNPQAGWTAQTNTAAATLGQPVESDSQFRARLTITVGLPSMTMLTSTVARIAATLGVTRYNVLENQTNTTDANGNPAHSLTAVVEGGTDNDVALAIYGPHGIGCDTNGTTSITITDAYTGSSFIVSFDRPTDVPIYVQANVHPLAGFSGSIVTQVQTGIVNYLNSLQIGERVTLSAIYAAAMTVTANLKMPTFSLQNLQIAPQGSGYSTNDAVLTFNQVAQGLAANVTLTST